MRLVLFKPWRTYVVVSFAAPGVQLITKHPCVELIYQHILKIGKPLPESIILEQLVVSVNIFKEDVVEALRLEGASCYLFVRGDVHTFRTDHSDFVSAQH